MPTPPVGPPKKLGGGDGGTGAEGRRLGRGVHGLAIQELPDARGDPRGVEIVLGVEALRVAGLTESPHPEPAERRRHHVTQRLGHGAPEAERQAIRAAFRATGRNKTEAARLLRVDYKTLHLKVKYYRIDAAEFRAT